VVGLYDPDPKHHLLDLLSLNSVAPAIYSHLGELNEALRRGEHRVAVVSLESIGADAKKRLEELRAGAVKARLVLVHDETTPRARFAQRLWAIGACDAVLPSSQASALRETVLRFEMEARVEEVHFQTVGDRQDEGFARFRAVHALFSALAGQEHADGVLHELSRGLRNLIEYGVLAVLLSDERGSKLHLFQTNSYPHRTIMEMAQRAVEATNLLTRTRPLLNAEELDFAQPTLLPVEGEQTLDDTARIETFPLVAGARVLGCIALLAHEWSKQALYALFTVASHTAVALERASTLETARKMSDTDPLTGVHNRRFLDKILESEWGRARRYSLQLSVIVLDIDNFAEINALRGRTAGDSVLVSLADGLGELIRTADHLLRLGGDQFLLLLPETGALGAERLIERVRVLLKTNPIQVEDASFTISVSCGVASFPTVEAETPHQLVAKAQEALSRAKVSGRNRTMHSGESVRAGPAGSEQRREPRMPLELPVTFVPVPELDPRSALRLSSVNISSSGLALRDRARLLKRSSFGLVFFDDRPHPTLCKVAWSRAIGSEYHAGLVSLKASDFHEAASDRGWEKRRALVITSDEEHLAIAKRVLRTTKHVVHAVDPNAEIADEVLVGCSLIVIGDRALQGPIGAKLFEARRKAKDDFRIIVINETLDRERAIEMISNRHVEHLIGSRSNPAESLFATLTKMLRREFFGVHRYLLAGADIKSWSVAKPAEKSFVLAGVRAVAEEIDCHPRITDLLISAVDEMLINALRNQPVTVECGADGRLLCVGVLDDHGALDVDQIYQGLEAASRAKVQGLPEEASSPHLGFRIMLTALSQLAINVEPSRRTEIIGIVDLRKSLRDHRAAAPSLGIFKK
jgi:diguanylate cyclase (GGDEF)-like protein